MKETILNLEGVEPPSWSELYKEFIHWVLEYETLHHWELSVTFCDSQCMQQYNREYRKKDEVTDVLSFPMEPREHPEMEEPFDHCLWGDLVICPDYVKSNAQYFQVPWEQEIRRVTIHGLLHLLGWNHKTNEDHEPMLQKQEIILASYNGRLF